MPRAGRICPTPGCPTVTTQGRCRTCREAADQARGTFRERGYRAGHDKFRKTVLQRDPTCVLCREAPSVVADHYPDSRRDLEAAGLDPDDPNRGRGLCKACDHVQTGQRQAGFHVR